MDFVRLDSTSYHSNLLVEGYISVIWTERFQDFGEFELRSYDIEGMRSQLPEGAFVSHLKTKEVMRVETHSIEFEGEGADAVPFILVKGRSVASILEHRFVESTYGKKRRMRKKYSATSALCVLLWQAVDNNSGKDVTRGDNDPDTPGVVNDYSWTTKDDIPNVGVTEKVPAEGATRWWKLSEGSLWPQFQKIMIDRDLGLRTIRPVSPNPGKVITVKTVLADRGDIVRTDTTDITSLRYEIYEGTDRTATVQFSQLQGHLDKPAYLFSASGFKRVVEVMAADINIGDVYRGNDNTVQGWDRLVIPFDAGDPEIPDPPEKPDDLGRNPTAAEKNAYYDAMDDWRTKMGKWRNKRDQLKEDFREESLIEAKRVLKQTRRVRMVQGDISELSPYQYKVHYDLGDTVLLVGDYGESEPYIVSEYVLTSDANGDRGLPGLILPDSE